MYEQNMEIRSQSVWEKIHNWIKNHKKLITLLTIFIVLLIVIIVLLSSGKKENNIRESLVIDSNHNLVDKNGKIDVNHEKEYKKNLLYKYGYDLVKAIQNNDKEKRSEYANKLYALSQSAFCRKKFNEGERDNELENNINRIYKTYKDLAKIKEGKMIISSMPAFYIDSIKLRNSIGFLIFTLSEATRQNKQHLKNEMLSALVEIGRDNACKMDLSQYTFKTPNKDSEGNMIWSTIWESSLKKDDKGNPIW